MIWLIGSVDIQQPQLFTPQTQAEADSCALKFQQFQKKAVSQTMGKACVMAYKLVQNMNIFSKQGSEEEEKIPKLSDLKKLSFNMEFSQPSNPLQQLEKNQSEKGMINGPFYAKFKKKWVKNENNQKKNRKMEKKPWTCWMSPLRPRRRIRRILILPDLKTSCTLFSQDLIL